MRLFLSVLAFFLFYFFSFQLAHANELQTFQSELGSLKQLVSMLQSQLNELSGTVQSQNEVIYKQAIQIQALERVSGTSVRETEIIPPGAPQTAGLAGFNPEIGLVGDITAKLTENKADREGNNTIALKELELNIAQVVDPFSRLDAVVSFNDALEAQNIEIEEGYYTHWGLPLGFLGQIGKFRSKVGKQNLLHLDQLETVDYPLVIRDFFGEEGLSSSGARLQNMISNPWDVPFEVTGEILRGNNGNSFSGISRRPIFNTHVKTFFDVTDNSNVELGWTTMFGDENIPLDNGKGTGTFVRPSEGQDRYGVQVFGGDVTFNWLLPEGRKLKWQNEMYVQSRSNLVHVNDDPWGFYSLLDLRMSQRWSAGVRFDFVEPLDVVGDQTRGVSPYITFWQSEFAQYRLQYSRLDPASDSDKEDNVLLFKVNVIIGAHKHPIQ